MSSAFGQKQPFIKNLNKWGENKVSALGQMMKKAVPATIVEVDKTGTIATVKFEIDSGFNLPQVKMPIHGPEFARMPLKKGDKGVVLSSDMALGAMSGLGEGTATLTPEFNLSTGVFFPIGNTEFEERLEGEDTKVVLYGPDGVILRTPGGKDGKVDVNEKGVIVSMGEDQGAVDVSDKGVTVYMQGGKKGAYFEATEGAFKFYVAGSLKFIIDAGGARYVGNAIPGAGGATYGINTTDTGTHIDNVNFLPHKHSGTQPGSGDTGVINILTSPALAANEDEPPP